MKLRLIFAMLVLVATTSAQVAAHAASAEGALPPAKMTSLQVTGKTMARVNGAEMSDRDLVREMFAIFPYAKQHNGFPEKLEPQIRKGALDMIIFEELVYQEAKRRNMTVAPARLAREEHEFRKQFPSTEVYQQFLREELKGSRQLLREKIRRSLLIEAFLKAEVFDKAKVSVDRGTEAFTTRIPKSLRAQSSSTFRRYRCCRPPIPGQRSPKKRDDAPTTPYNRRKKPRITRSSGCWQKRFPTTTTG